MTSYYRPRPLPADATYGESYWRNAVDPDGNVRDLTQEREQKLEDMREELEFISDVAISGLICDVGCGLGTSTRWLKENTNGAVVGVEPDDAAREAARAYFPGGIFHARMADMTDKVDAVLMYHVVEHMADPEAEVRKVHRALKPGGHLVISTPDFGSPVARAYGDRFRLLHDKTHISLFSSWSLCLMLRDLGFEILDVRWPYFGTRHHTRENLLRLEDTSAGVSPPAPGSIVSIYARKP